MGGGVLIAKHTDAPTWICPADGKGTIATFGLRHSFIQACRLVCFDLGSIGFRSLFLARFISCQPFHRLVDLSHDVIDGFCSWYRRIMHAAYTKGICRAGTISFAANHPFNCNCIVWRTLLLGEWFPAIQFSVQDCGFGSNILFSRISFVCLHFAVRSAIMSLHRKGLGKISARRCVMPRRSITAITPISSCLVCHFSLSFRGAGCYARHGNNENQFNSPTSIAV